MLYSKRKRRANLSIKISIGSYLINSTLMNFLPSNRKRKLKRILAFTIKHLTTVFLNL
jgi:hypothetical protein